MKNTNHRGPLEMSEMSKVKKKMSKIISFNTKYRTLQKAKWVV